MSTSAAPRRLSLGPPAASGSTSEALASIREAARSRFALLAHRVRSVGAVVWLAIATGFGTWSGNPGYLRQARWVAGYLVLALLLDALARRSVRVRAKAHLFTAFVDVPFVAAAQTAILADRPGDAHPATVGVAMLMILVMGSISSLEPRAIAAVTAMALAGQIVLDGHSTIAFADGRTNEAIILLAGMIAIGVARFCSGLLERAASEMLRNARMARYFSPSVARSIIDASEDAQTRREVTVLFVDVRGFTAFSEASEPAESVAVLNEYFEELVACVFDHGGTLDKYLGDGLLAYFGAPRSSDTHADDAMRCACAMLDAVDEVNARRRARGVTELRVGIGVHSGPAVVGDIGARRRREFTIIGDTVNVASRVEGLTKEFAVPLACSEATRTLTREAFPWRPLGGARVRGREQAVDLWTVEREAGALRSAR